MIRFPCSKCGGSYPKYRRMKLRDSGKRTPSMATYCILCHRGMQAVRDTRIYDKKLAYNRKWRKRNREVVNKYKRDAYRKSRDSGIFDVSIDYEGCVNWHGAKSIDGFSTLRYTPLYVDGRR